MIINKDLEDIIQRGKDAIRQLALELIYAEVTADNFTKINIMASSKEVYVSFLIPIKYLPTNSAYNCDLEVSLIEKSISYHGNGNPIGYEEDKMDLPFYTETEDGKKNILFVLEAIGKMVPFDVSKFEDSIPI